MSWNKQCISLPHYSNEGKVGTQLRIVDLTQHLSNDMPLYPGMPRPSFVDIATVEVDGYAMSEYHLLNHVGTHVDAPSHHSMGPTLDDMPLERFVTGAVVLDFSQHEHGAISGAEITPHLARIKPGDIVLIYSGGSRYWGTDNYWTGWCYPDAEAAQALIERGISAIGFDGPSADPVETTQSWSFPPLRLPGNNRLVGYSVCLHPGGNFGDGLLPAVSPG
jgi:arylformamidase